MPATGTAADNTMALVGMREALQPWAASYLLATFSMWALMMVAMMLPSAAPMVLLHARIDRGSQRERAFASLLFMSCYVLVWILFSAIATLLQAALIDSNVVSSGTLLIGDRVLAAGLLLAAAFWQLSSAKSTCLNECQSPLQFVLRHWSPGPVGAVRLGLVHGLFCVGCCWSLMLLLFVGGVMNLIWVAGLAALVFLEKTAPPNWRADKWIAGLLVVGAAGTLLSQALRLA
jgi:predicted metal-binding membrane protein